MTPAAAVSLVTWDRALEATLQATMDRVSLMPTRGVIQLPNTVPAPVVAKILLRATEAGHMKRMVMGKCSRRALTDRMVSSLALRAGQNSMSSGMMQNNWVGLSQDHWGPLVYGAYRGWRTARRMASAKP